MANNVRVINMIKPAIASLFFLSRRQASCQNVCEGLTICSLSSFSLEAGANLFVEVVSDVTGVCMLTSRLSRV